MPKAKSNKPASPASKVTAPKPEPCGPKILYVLSDSTGNLAKHMLTAFLTQFPREAFCVRAKTFLETQPRLERVLNEISAERGIVFHALVSPQFKKLVEDRCAKAKIPHCDLTGSFVDFLARESGIQPAADSRRLHDVDEIYHRRIRAIEFALQHDDGLGLDTIHEADLVLAGVSRTSKTPTTIYLAQQGFYVGNVSLAHGIEPPQELMALPPGKVVGLTIDSTQLIEIRTRRQREWGVSSTRYNDPEAVENEIHWTRRLFARKGWPVLNVTDQAVEETAARVLEIANLSLRPERS